MDFLFVETIDTHPLIWRNQWFMRLWAFSRSAFSCICGPLCVFLLYLSHPRQLLLACFGKVYAACMFLHDFFHWGCLYLPVCGTEPHIMAMVVLGWPLDLKVQFKGLFQEKVFYDWSLSVCDGMQFLFPRWACWWHTNAGSMKQLLCHILSGK